MEVTLTPTLAVILFIIAGATLAKCSSLAVKALVTVAHYFRIPDFVVSFILMSIATSLPELVISAIAAAGGESVFALSTVIGSNVVDLTIVAGILAIVAGNMGVKKVLERREAYYTGAVCLVLLLFLLDGQISRLEGGGLIGVYALYMVHLFSQAKNYPQKHAKPTRSELLKGVVFLVVGVGGLVLGAKGLVWSAETLSVEINAPFVLVGLLLVSLSTAIPELAFEIRAWKHHHHDLALGDLLGSVVTNAALITGVIALIQPINAADSALNIDTALVFLLFSTVIFLFFLRTKHTLNRIEGVILIGVYLLFIALMYFQTMLG